MRDHENPPVNGCAKGLLFCLALYVAIGAVVLFVMAL